MSLLRQSVTRPPSSPDRSPEVEKIEDLQRELRAIRPSIPWTEPPPKPAPEARSARALLLLGDLARQQVMVGQLDEARRSIGEAVLILDEIKDEVTIAHASVTVGEAILGLDAPHHAKPRFARAVEILDRTGGDPRWRVRARLGLARTMIALDDIVGLAMLDQCHQVCKMLNERAALAIIEEEFREAEKIFDTPRHIHTGYGRPVSVVPVPPK
jgi:hypothetical protein